MAINFEPIFSEMANGPEKIKENFDKVKTIVNTLQCDITDKKALKITFSQ